MMYNRKYHIMEFLFYFGRLAFIFTEFELATKPWETVFVFAGLLRRKENRESRIEKKEIAAMMYIRNEIRGTLIYPNLPSII